MVSPKGSLLLLCGDQIIRRQVWKERDKSVNYYSNPGERGWKFDLDDRSGQG